MKYLLIITLFFVACKKEQKNEDSTSLEKKYFDLVKIVKTDIDNNSTKKCGEEKTVSINGKPESKKIDTVDWKKEMQLLLDCDINKPSWKGKYNVQILNDSLKYLYIAVSTKIPVRQLAVNYEQKNGRIISIEIKKKTGTALFSNEQQIIYFPEKSFKVNGSQQALFMQDFNSEVEIKYLCKN